MKNVLILSILFFLSLPAVFCDQIVLIRNELFLTKISDAVYVATHYFPWESNSLVVKTDKGNFVFIDTPYTDAATEVLYNWVRSNYSPKDIKAIVTGYHIDNVGGVGFLRSKDIEVIGSRLTNSLIESHGSNSLRTLSLWLNPSTQKKFVDHYSTATLVKATTEIELRDLYSYQFDDVKLELFYPGESHSVDNLTVFIENGNILFGTCIIKSLENRNLGFTGDANLENWPNAVRRIKERYRDARVVIPHHGKWGGPELFDHTLSLF